MRLRHLLICLQSLFLAPDALWATGDDGVVVGKTADSHNVTDNGQFTYTMPVAVASGTGGISPKLSIAYGNSSGMGYPVTSKSLHQNHDKSSPSTVNTPAPRGHVGQNLLFADEILVTGDGVLQCRC